MNKPKTVLITGAAGNLGAKLRQHLEGRYRLMLLDIDPRGDGAIVQADLSTWTKGWLDLFQGVDVVVHFAADPTAFQTWPKLIAPNLDVLINVYQASVQAGVKRMIYASSNHVMGGYQNVPQPAANHHRHTPQAGHAICSGWTSARLQHHTGRPSCSASGWASAMPRVMDCQ